MGRRKNCMFSEMKKKEEKNKAAENGAEGGKT